MNVFNQMRRSGFLLVDFFFIFSVILYLVSASAISSSSSYGPSTPPEDWSRLNYLVVGIPLSPLHSLVAISQELCLRGHNVTVASLGADGLKKTIKYSPKCTLNYVELAPMPMNKHDMDDLFANKVGATNSTVRQMHAATTNLFSKFLGKLHEPLDKMIEAGQLKPDFALVSLPLGEIAAVLDKHGVGFAVNIPTGLLPPLSDAIASWVPPGFAQMSVYDMSIIDRLGVLAFNKASVLARRVASAAGLIPRAASDLDPFVFKGKLILVNSIPGLDYPQPLPPLIQYTGPVIDTEKMEPFPPEVESWLENVPEDKPVVYVSFGTVAVIKPDQAEHMVNTVFAGGDFHVLWALPETQQKGLPPGEIPSHIMVHHWISTVRALAHPKVKAFVSHCGGNSLSESMATGTPIVGYPQFGDQPANCQRLADAKAGITAPMRQSWVQKGHIMEVLQNPAYSQRANALRRLFKNFGGVTKAADLLEAAAAGDLELLTLPTDKSFWAWFLLNGYDIAILAILLSFVASHICWAAIKKIVVWHCQHSNMFPEKEKFT